MLDCNKQAGYQEMATPFVVKARSMEGTGQLPKFKSDLYKIADQDLYLIPTSEVTLINLFAGNTFATNDLPKKLTQYSTCFRQEAGAAGKSSRGVIRLHQFDKVEIAAITPADQTSAMLEAMTTHAAHLLELLELPYRQVLLCTAELGFAAQKTYDLEV